MKTKLLPLIILILASCALAPVSYWYDNYQLGVDLSVGCPNVPITIQDIAAIPDGEELRVVANVRRTPGLFTNAIAGIHLPQTPGTYVVSGSFRHMGSFKNELIDINLQWVEGHVEYYSEILMSYNPWSPLYGNVWTRNTHVPGEEMILFPFDATSSRWHPFELVADHLNHEIISIKVDQTEHVFNPPLPMGTVAKDWESSFMVLFESTNMYPGSYPNGNCRPNIYTGGADFKDVEVTLLP